MPDPIFDPISGPAWAINGRVVTMTAPGAVLDDGTIYISGGRIEAVQPADQPPPVGFEGIRPLRTGGTIFPGMIELHNHLAYNVLPLWQVPRQFDHRGQWGEHRDYRKLISGPMNVLGKTDGLIQAVVRWTEAKLLIAGTTTSQGIKLFSNADTRRYYRGLVRNVEETNDDALPEAEGKIGDVEARSAAKFLARLESKKRRNKKLILHLAEGRNDVDDDTANQHFRALKIDDRNWAINEALVGIHGTGLRGRNFATLRSRGGSIVWSPLSNLLLYGATTDVGRALDEGVPISLGSDWSPSGSKNLLMELKAARLHCQMAGIDISDFELVRMVTANPAAMVGWGAALGTIETGHRADLMVISGRSGDPYERLIGATETRVSLVVINGVRRYGQRRLMGTDPALEDLDVAGSPRRVDLRQGQLDPLIADLSIADAEALLRHALTELPTFAFELEQGASTMSLPRATASMDVVLGRGATVAVEDGDADEAWFLELDHLDDDGGAHRHQLDLDGLRTGVFPSSLAASAPLSELLDSVDLDPLAAADDRRLWDTIGRQVNLPQPVRDGLLRSYGRRPPRSQATGVVGGPVADALADADQRDDTLDREGCVTIVEQALVVMTEGYVHLPFKEALHAVDPVQRLRLLRYRLTQTSDEDFDPLWFHGEMIRTFTSVRDLHTSYLLPPPFRNTAAVLPFQLEECFEPDDTGTPTPRYLVSKTTDDATHPSFVSGVEVVHWNGVPIGRAIERLADQQAAGNAPAAFARALDAMTVRPLVTALPPDEDWVTITYRDHDGRIRSTRKEWRLMRLGASIVDDGDDASALGLGVDVQTSHVGNARKWLFAPAAAQAEQDAGGQVIERPLATGDGRIATNMPGIFRARTVVGDGGDYGYLRIFSFSVNDDDAFVDEFQHLVEQMPERGLIIDVRGNGGGLIHAAERALQILTPHPIKPSRAQFTTSPLLLEVCRRHGPGTGLAGLDLSEWVPSLAQSVATGSAYSRGYPITDEAAANDRGQRYFGPVVLIVDALSYSATDIFAAGFLDHEIGPVLGTADNTGAGGANVWRHRDLLWLRGDDSALEPLPGGAEMRVAVRRITRVGRAEGEVLEDLGIDIEHRHHMTTRDITGSNEDLIARAIELLGSGRR